MEGDEAGAGQGRDTQGICSLIPMHARELDRAGTSFPCMHGSWTGIMIGMVKSVVFLVGFGPEGSTPSPVQQDRLDEDSCYQV